MFFIGIMIFGRQKVIKYFVIMFNGPLCYEENSKLEPNVEHSICSNVSIQVYVCVCVAGRRSRRRRRCAACTTASSPPRPEVHTSLYLNVL